MNSNMIRRRAAAALTAPLIAATIVATAPTAHAATNYGAIAYAPNGQAGASHNYSTRADAEANAVSACGLSACKVLVSFTDCGAVAENATKYQGGYGPTLAAAQADALAKLGGGHIDSWACNG
jgi:hypothetical protein